MSLLPHEHQSGLFIRAPLASVADFLVNWGNEVDRGTVAERKRMPLEEAWNHVADRKPGPPTRAFLIPVEGGWTAFFDNHRYEWLAQAELFVLCEGLRTDTCFFSCNDAEDSPQRGSGHFCYYRYMGVGERPIAERQVMCHKESGWEFHQSGEPLPFEDRQAYARPKKRERLTAELMRSYGKAMNLPFWDAAAYDDEVVLLRWGDRPPPDGETTLKKLIKLFGQPQAILRGRRRTPQ